MLLSLGDLIPTDDTVPEVTYVGPLLLRAFRHSEWFPGVVGALGPGRLVKNPEEDFDSGLEPQVDMIRAGRLPFATPDPSMEPFLSDIYYEAESYSKGIEVALDNALTIGEPNKLFRLPVRVRSNPFFP